MKFASLRDEMLSKARESALLAVEIYNKPSVKFRSGGYTVLMVIAWTSLFHAIFYKRHVKPFERRGRKIKTLQDGEPILWDLQACAQKYFDQGLSDPIAVNLNLFIPLRNKFEHRSFPLLDSILFGECQALLLNFDEILGKEFGDDKRIRESLAFSLQLFPSSESLETAIRKNADVRKMAEFISTYRSTISTEVMNSGKYSFKAFLIQVSNHNNRDSLPVQFINYDKLSEDEKGNIEQFVHLTREKIVNVPVINEGWMRPREVVRKVNIGLGNPKKKNVLNNERSIAFTLNVHVSCYKHYNARPGKESPKKQVTEANYCRYDGVNNNYVYSEEWVKFLIAKFGDKSEFEKILNLTNGRGLYVLD